MCAPVTGLCPSVKYAHAGELPGGMWPTHPFIRCVHMRLMSAHVSYVCLRISCLPSVCQVRPRMRTARRHAACAPICFFSAWAHLHVACVPICRRTAGKHMAQVPIRQMCAHAVQICAHSSGVPPCRATAERHVACAPSCQMCAPKILI